MGFDIGGQADLIVAIVQFFYPEILVRTAAYPQFCLPILSML